MDSETFRALVEDVRSHGQRDTATLCDGMVIDGWHRYKACQELNIPCRFENSPGWMQLLLSAQNQHRRHYQRSQQAAIEVSLTAWAESPDHERASCCGPFRQTKKWLIALVPQSERFNTPSAPMKPVLAMRFETERLAQRAAELAGLTRTWLRRWLTEGIAFGCCCRSKEENKPGPTPEPEDPPEPEYTPLTSDGHNQGISGCPRAGECGRYFRGRSQIKPLI